MNLSFDHKNPYHLSSLFLVLFLLLAIPLTVALVLQSEFAGRNAPKAAVVRDKYTWPFASNSIWNLPIGTNAQYIQAGIQNANAWRGEITIDEEFIGVNPNDPIKSINGISAHVPSSMSHDGGWNGCATFVRSSDKDTLISGQPLVLPSGGNGSWQYNYSNPPSGGGNMSLQGDGRYGCHGGSALSGIGGSLRKGELNSTEPIRHALKINLYAKRFLSCSSNGYRWPAFRADAYMSCSSYGGSIPQARMGSLLALKPDVNCGSVASSNHARKICKALQDYGGYVVDDTYWDVHALNVSWDAEFGDGGTFHSDVQRLFSMLHVVDNWNESLYNTVKNSNGTQGSGGGSPRVAWAPDFGQSTGETTPPTVTITAPTNGSTVSGTITFSANASDNTGGSGMSRVEFLVDNSLVKTVNGAGPYTFQYDTNAVPNGSRSFRANAYDNAGNQSFNQIAVTVSNSTTTPPPPPPPSTGGTVPTPWVTRDIGAVGITGSAGYNNGIFTLVGSGSDIWDSTDSFRYVYQDLLGDGSIVTRITSQTNSNAWAKAGVMIRSTTNPDSMHAMLVTTPTNGLAFQYRSATAANSNHVTGGSYTFPVYLKLERAGDTIKASKSTDGTNYTQVGSVSIPLGTTPKIGLAVLAHDNTKTSQAVFDNVSVTKTTISAPVISNLLSTPTVNSADVTWTTNQTALSTLVYGTTTSYGSTVAPDLTMKTSHKYTIVNLTPATTYYFKVESKNSAGQVTTATGSFKTLALVLGTSMEAETMKIISGWIDPSKGNIFQDSSASGGKGIISWSNGTFLGELAGTGTSFTVRARGDQCNGSPRMIITVDGKVVGTVGVAATSWTDYKFNVSLTNNTAHTVTITFDNDYWKGRGSNCDRNLRVDKLTLQ